jgi:hypothetical protein
VQERAGVIEDGDEPFRQLAFIGSRFIFGRPSSASHSMP